MSWTLTVGETEKTLAAWGITDLAIKMISSAPDELTFRQHAQYADDLDFAYGASITLKNGATTRFVGTIATPTRTGIPGPNLAAAAPLQYRAVNSWDQLNRLIFEQQWTQETGTTPATVAILNQDIAGARVTTGNQIKEALDYAVAQGADIGYVSADLSALDIKPVETEETDPTVGDVVLNMLRWHKDVSTWFDYTADPPNIRFTKRGSATSASVDLDQANASDITITERHDLTAAGVVIKYSAVNNSDGTTWNTFTTDSAGSTSGIGVIKMTVELQGFSSTTESAEVVVVTAPSTDAEIQNWLIARNPWLEDDQIDPEVAIVWDSHDVSSTMPKILASGSLPEWADEDTEVGVIFAIAKITYLDGTVKRVNVSNEQVFTEATNGTYYNASSYTPAEAAPTGVAAAVYAQLSTLQYQGTIKLKLSEVDGSITPGKVLNLTNGRTAWATMNAQIQSVVERPSAGVGLAYADITFGPAEHLSAQDFIEISRANRQRKPAMSSVERTSGVRGNNIDLTGTSPANNSASDGIGFEKFVVAQTVEEEEHTIVLDPYDTTWAAGKGLVVKSDGLSTEWGTVTGTPDVTDKSEYMVLQLVETEVPDSSPTEYVLTPTWDWVKLATPPEE